MNRMNRRAFLKTGIAAATASSLADLVRADNKPAGQNGPAIATGLPDVVVVGAGVFGAFTALTLCERGFKVTLLDAYGPANPLAASCDETREIRAGYGDRELYTRWAIQALEHWKIRQQEWNRKLYYPTGRLQLATKMKPEFEAQKRVFDKLSIPYELLRHDELQRRYPQLGFEGVEIAFFESGLGVLRARDAIIAVTEAFERKGGALRVARGMPGSSAGRRMHSVILGDGENLAAGTFVFACGPWLRKVFVDLLGKKIVTPRAESFYFAIPPGDTRFSCPNIPCVSEDENDYYALPCVEVGLKMVPSFGVLQVDPDAQERIVSPFLVRRARELVALRYPALRNQPIVETRVCQTEYSADNHFIIDRHPDFDNVWIAGGGSGHGFKHGPIIGEYVADRITGHLGDPELARMFGLSGRPDRS